MFTFFNKGYKTSNLDQELINQLKNGKETLFKDFYLRERDRFINWCKTEMKLSDLESQDCYQNAQMHLYENIIHGKLEELTSALSTYLYGIGKNLIHIKYRKDSVRIRHDSHLTEHLNFLTGTDSKQTEKQSLIQKIEEGIGKMLDPCKTLLILFYYENLSFRIIADRMGYKNDSVAKNQKKRCLDKLREMTQK